ncbi:MAG: preprotein translocase subunit SecY, partial [bacterium]|nr:preprotein translocase subunit SecY [bacterium]
VLEGGWSFRLMTMNTPTEGAAFIMWPGQQITERGVGNGISLIIFANIVARFPSAIVNMVKLIQAGEMNVLIAILLIILMFAVIAFIVFFESAQRKIPIQYPKRVVGRKVMGGGTQHLPMKVNAAGVIPPIFASSILFFPATIVQFTDNSMIQSFADLMNPGGVMYNVVFIVATIFFTFFYTAIQYNPKEIADNLKKNGGFVPGIRPGANTASYLDAILTRLTFWGAIYL